MLPEQRPCGVAAESRRDARLIQMPVTKTAPSQLHKLHREREEEVKLPSSVLFSQPCHSRAQQIQMETTDGKRGHQRTEITLGDLSLTLAEFEGLLYICTEGEELSVMLKMIFTFANKSNDWERGDKVVLATLIEKCCHFPASSGYGIAVNQNSMINSTGKEKEFYLL